MTERTYRIRIVRGDQQFEAEGDKAFVLDMLNRYEKPASSLPARPEKRRGEKTTRQEVLPPATSEKSLSVGEFVRQLGLKRHTDLVVAFGYYLEHQRGVKEFTPADINNCYYEAKLESSNTSQMLINNIWGAYDILENKIKCSIPEKPDLELLHEERNNIQHKYSNPSPDDAAFHIERAMAFINRFARDELGLDIADFISSEFLDKVL